MKYQILIILINLDPNILAVNMQAVRSSVRIARRVQQVRRFHPSIFEQRSETMTQRLIVDSVFLGVFTIGMCSVCTPMALGGCFDITSKIKGLNKDEILSDHGARKI